MNTERLRDMLAVTRDRTGGLVGIGDTVLWRHGVAVVRAVRDGNLILGGGGEAAPEDVVRCDRLFSLPLKEKLFHYLKNI